MNKFLMAAVFGGCMLATQLAGASDVTHRYWDGEGGDMYWSNPLNWDGDTPLQNDGTEILWLDSPTTTGAFLLDYGTTNWRVKGVKMRLNGGNYLNYALKANEGTSTLELGSEGIDVGKPKDSGIEASVSIILTEDSTWNLATPNRFRIKSNISGDYTLTLSNSVMTGRAQAVSFSGANTFQRLHVVHGEMTYNKSQSVVPTVIESTADGYKFSGEADPTVNLGGVTNLSGNILGHGNSAYLPSSEAESFASTPESRVRSITLDYFGIFGTADGSLYCSTNFAMNFVMDARQTTVCPDFVLAPEFTGETTWTFHYDLYIGKGPYNAIFEGCISENKGKLNLDFLCENRINAVIQQQQNYTGNTTIRRVRIASPRDGKNPDGTVEGMLHLRDSARLGFGDITISPAALETVSLFTNMTVNMSAATEVEGMIDTIPDESTLILESFDVDGLSRFGRIDFGDSVVTERVGKLIVGNQSYVSGVFTSQELPDYILGQGALHVVGSHSLITIR